MLGISFKPSGRSASSSTRCANRMGSSSERNCDARNKVPGNRLRSVDCSNASRQRTETTHPSKDCYRTAPCIRHCQPHGYLPRPTSALAVFSMRGSCLHLSERHTSRREIRIVLDHVRQLSRRLPGHLAGSVGAQGPKALAGTTGGLLGGGASEARSGPIDDDCRQVIGSRQ